MLCNSARFTGNHIGIPNIVEQGCFSVIHVSHHRHNRRTRLPIFRIILFFFNSFGYFGTYIFRLESELLRNDVDRLGIETLIDRHHHTDAHTGRDHLRDRDIHHVCQIVSRHKLGQLQHLAFLCFFKLQFLFTVCYGIALLTTIFGAFVLSSFTCETSQRFFHLLLYIFLTDLGTNRLLQSFPSVIMTAPVIIAASIGTHRRVDIDFILLDPFTFLFSALARCRCCIGRTYSAGCRLRLMIRRCLLFTFLFAFFSALFFALLLRTHRLVDRRQIYFACYFNGRFQFRLS